jgi:hypothetical protein
MAGGNQGVGGSQGRQLPSGAPSQGYKAAAPSISPQQMQQLQAIIAAGHDMQRVPVAPIPPEWMSGQTKPMMIGQGPVPTGPIQGQTRPMQVQGNASFGGAMNHIPGYADGGFVDAGFMQYPYQGQPNQPDSVPLLTSQPPTVQNDGGPDAGGNYVGASMGFDGSGSDAGVGGQPVNQVQTPLQQQGNKPIGLSQFRPQQGLQIAGNPTSQVVQRPQQR